MITTSSKWTISCWVFYVASLVLLPSYTWSQEASPTISVRGAAHIVLEADRAVISVSIVERAFRAEEAFAKQEDRKKAILEFLSKANVEPSAVRVQPLSLFKYEIDRPGKQSSFKQQAVNKQNADGNDKTNASEPTFGFQAGRRLKVTLTKLDQLDTIHVGFIQMGLDRLDSIEFQSSKASEQFELLREEAVREARSKATSMAQQLGSSLTSIKSMVDSSAPLPSDTAGVSRLPGDDPFGSDGGMGGSMGGYGSPSRGTSTSSTQIQLSATVDVVFWLDRSPLKK